MKDASKTMRSAAWLGLGLIWLGSTAFAQSKNMDMGKQEFETHCAVCHASSGKGDGPYVPMLRQPPSDLTTLAKRNGGILPVNRIYETIEGGDVPSHGSREMPIWGSAFRVQAGEYYFDTPYNPETYVRSRILTLVEYINRLQVR